MLVRSVCTVVSLKRRGLALQEASQRCNYCRNVSRTRELFIDSYGKKTRFCFCYLVTTRLFSFLCRSNCRLIQIKNVLVPKQKSIASETGLVGAPLGCVLLQPRIALSRVVSQASRGLGNGLHHLGRQRISQALRLLDGACGADRRGLQPRSVRGARMGFLVRPCCLVGHHVDRTYGQAEKYFQVFQGC